MSRAFRSAKAANEHRTKVTDGYAANGLSIHSRDAAHSQIALTGYTPGLRRIEKDRPRPAAPRARILKLQDELATLRKRLPLVAADRREKTLRDIDAKTNFIKKLEREIAGVVAGT